MTFSTSSSLSLRGAPGRGSSSRPSTPRSVKRLLHLLTLCRLMPCLIATSLSDAPSTQARITRQRLARAWPVVGRKLNLWSSARCCSLKLKAKHSNTEGRPVRGLSGKLESRLPRNRDRHWPTLCTDTCSCEATAMLVAPVAQARMMRALRRSRCLDSGPSAIRSNSKRSTSVKLSFLRGRPCAILPSLRYYWLTEQPLSLLI